jgi:hypothetical protein
VSAGGRVDVALLDEAPHRLLVGSDRHLDPARGKLVQKLDERGAETALDGSRNRDPAIDQILQPLRLAWAVTGDHDRVAVDRTHNLQPRLGAVASVGENVGEGRDPSHVGLPCAKGLDHRRIAGGDLRAQGQAAVGANEAGQLVAPSHQSALFDRRYEEHLHRLLAAHLELRSPVQTPDEGHEQQADNQPADARFPGVSSRLIHPDGGQRSTASAGR